MSARLDNMPKQFRRLACIDCQEEFQATGPSAKRCQPCRAIHKNAYERERDRASRVRPVACIECGAPFPPGVHAAVKRCAPCSEMIAKKQRKEFQGQNLGLFRAYNKKRYEKDKDKILAKSRTPEGRAQKARIIRERRQRDPGFRLHSNVSRLVALSLNGDKGGRGWESLVGYTRADLVRHLERQFTKGMTWENMGGEAGWQVDHILPRAMFSFDGPDDPGFKACWALTNLRPLWRNENASKREKRVHLI